MQKARDILYDVLLCKLGSEPGAMVIDGLVGLSEPVDVMQLADHLAETMGIFDMLYAPIMTPEDVAAQFAHLDYEQNGQQAH